ncbi:hypothetical protein STAFG_0371 [Streptomyces afghaniensis 772]|uniref:Uncharacterized protein n=1 Tax=Streptomyces afghaniensis 772 TaxID=1283301 RepID=S4MSQ7_9ACTN|nr:hypothetical protein STAFG_0371 [Streptomyces afghaniensis 772]
MAHRVKENLTAFFRAEAERGGQAIPTCWPGSSA